MTLITEAGLHLNGLNAKSSKNNIANINIKIKIDSVDQLKELMRKLRRLKGIVDVYRMNN